MKIDETAYGHERDPGEDMDQVVEKPAHCGRPVYFKKLKAKTEDHAKNGDLIPGEKHLPEIERPLHAGRIGCIFPIIILGQRESTGYHKHILGHGKELDIGKSFFSINNVSTDTSDGSNVGKHGRNDEGSFIPLIGKSRGEKMRSHQAGNEAHENGEKRNHDDGSADGKDPETQDIQYRHHHKYIKTDEPVAEYIIDDSGPFEQVSQSQWPQNVDDDQNPHGFTSLS